MTFTQKCETGQTLWYEINNDEKTVSVQRGENKTTGELVIPASITYEGIKYAVTSIGDSAFEFCYSLTSVIIPNSVTSIGERAFEVCSGLTEVTIPDSVTSIGERAFAHCTGLTSITIPNSVTSIGDSAFYNCTELPSIDVAADNPSYKSIDGVLHSKDGNVLILCPKGKDGDFTIPNSVTSIGEDAFQGCKRLTSIDVAADNPNYKSIDGVLYDKDVTTFICCPEGKQGSVTIPNSVTSIGDSAFYNCTELTSIDVAADNPNYKSIDGVLYSKGGNVLILCPKGKDGDFTIPNSVTSIGDWAFSYCEGLTSITIGASVTSIGEGAFEGCEELTSITVPNSVTSIGGGAFSFCTGLTSVSIPNSVTSIGDAAFFYCTGLTSITIPDSVTRIGEEAFYCTGLTEITCKAVVPPTIEEETFAKYRREYFYDLPLYVPAASVEAYKTANYWKEFKDIKPLK